MTQQNTIPPQVPPQAAPPVVATPPVQQQAPPQAAPSPVQPVQQQVAPPVTPPQQAAPPQAAPAVVAPPQPEPAAAAPPLPDPAVAAETERIQQERSLLAQQQQQLQQDKFRAALGTSVEQTRQYYIQQGATAAVANMAAGQYQQAEERRMDDYVRFQNAMQEMTAKQTLATNLSQKYGIPTDDLMGLNDAQSMETVAIQHQRHTQDFTSLQEQFNAMRDGIANQNAPPQAFNGPGGMAPPSTDDLSQYMGTVAENGSYIVNDQKSFEAMRDKLIADGSLRF